MANTIEVFFLEEEHIEVMVKSLNGTNVSRKREYFLKCLEECQHSKRITLVAFINEDFAGSVNIIYESKYEYFRKNNIPELNDLLVAPKYRKKGVGERLLEEAEEITTKTHDYLGLGVGLYKDYGSAHRLYARKGYIPDGSGIMYDYKPVKPGEAVAVDDSLLLFLYKKLK
ncbi:MAG: GNAT family N-acetyltransferase [Bacillota bacterium]